MAITIQTSADWELLRQEKLETVVDPMVLRCGELFLQGARGAADPVETWELLTKNIHAVGMFFDRLILNEKIPVFNYGDTFDAMLNFDQRVLTTINDYDEVLYDIDVEYAQYHKVKDAALAEVKDLYTKSTGFQLDTASEIAAELSAAEYKWKPSIGDLEQYLQSDEQKTAAAFLVGGLIFGGYAQLLEGEHVLQPKRSRLILATALRARSVDYKLEEVLFDQLKSKVNTPCEDLPWMPTFFPYLLSKASSPTEILKEVVNLRMHSNEVDEYRKWLQEVMDDWKENGRISQEKRNDVRAIARYIDRILGGSMPRIKVKWTVADAIAPKPPGAIDFTPPLERLWGWFIASLPGNRYRKLLSRAIAADREYVLLDNRVKTVWEAG
jgi:hypothetical protein